MKRSHIIRRTAVLTAALGALGAAGLGGRVFAQTPRAAVTPACAATGVYMVGSSPMPIRPVTPRRGARPMAAGPAQQSVPAHLAAPRGTLTVEAYAGCGSPTRGSFSVRFGGALPALAAPQDGVAPRARPAARTQTLSGTFAATSATTGGATSSTVTVKAVLSTTTPSATGRAAVTTAAVDVIGVLQVSPDGRSAVLTLPEAGSASATSVIYGHRGTDRPNYE